jgi:CO/xanthine dehydrogenase Mo-binding subunit
MPSRLMEDAVFQVRSKWWQSKRQPSSASHFPRVESNAKVTGAAQYVDDMQFGPNLLHGQLKRSTVPHAMIKRIDVSKARALPGVRVVGDRAGLSRPDRALPLRPPPPLPWTGCAS